MGQREGYLDMSFVRGAGDEGEEATFQVGGIPVGDDPFQCKPIQCFLNLEILF